MLLIRVPDIICKKSRKLSSYDRKGAKAARFEVAMHGRSRNAAPRRSEVCNGFGLVLEECLRRRDLSWGFEQCNSKPAPCRPRACAARRPALVRSRTRLVEHGGAQAFHCLLRRTILYLPCIRVLLVSHITNEPVEKRQQ